MFNDLTSVLDDYKKNGVRVSIEIPQREVWKLFALAVGVAIAITLATTLIKKIIE